MKTYSKLQVLAMADDLSKRWTLANNSQAADMLRAFAQTLGEPVATPDEKKAILDGVSLLEKVAREFQEAVADIFALRSDGQPYNERDTTKDSDAMWAFQRLNDKGVRLRTVIGQIRPAIERAWLSAAPHHPTTEKGCE